MDNGWLQFSVPIIALIINVFSQIISKRCVKGLSLLKSEFLGCAAGFLGIFGIEFFLFSKGKNPIALTIANLIIYLSLEYCYFTFINLGETARRIRILRELYDSKEGLSMEEILAKYNAREIFKKRTERLVNNGQVLFRNGRYTICNPTMLFIAKAIVILKMAVLGKRSEFD
jgi:hypothetical protein